jgi:hypothetical protein
VTSRSSQKLQRDGVRFISATPLTIPSLSSAERLAEITEILAAGLIRLRARKSSPFSNQNGESSLDCPAHQSGHANVLKRQGGPN